MWCWYVIVNRRSADGFDYNKLYGPTAAPEQTIRTSAVKKAFIDKDLWNQGPRITGIQRITLIVGTAIFLIDSGMIPQDDSKLYILVLRNFITLGRKFLIIFFSTSVVTFLSLREGMSQVTIFKLDKHSTKNRFPLDCFFAKSYQKVFYYYIRTKRNWEKLQCYLKFGKS